MNGVVDQPSFAEIYDGGGRRAPLLPTDGSKISSRSQKSQWWIQSRVTKNSKIEHARPRRTKTMRKPKAKSISLAK